MAKLKNGNLWLEYNNQQLSGTKTLSNTDNQFQFLDPNGANRDVLLPSSTTAGGLEFTIVNTTSGIYTLTVKDSTGNTTITTIDPEEISKFACNGTIWKTMGGMPEGFLASSIVNGDTTHAPSGDSVFDKFEEVEQKHIAKIPIRMTLNNVPSPIVISATSSLVGTAPWLAFDENTDVSYRFGWVSNTGDLPAYLKIDFGSALYTIREYKLYPWSSSYYIKNWTFEGSNNDTDWTVLDTQTNQIDTSPNPKTFTFYNTTAYRYYKINVTDARTNTGDLAPYAFINELELYVYGAQALEIINDTAYVEKTKSHLMVDFFNRADTSLGNIGTSDSGHDWILQDSLSAVPTLTKIDNKRWISAAGNAAYAIWLATRKISRLGARISFATAGGASEQANFVMGWTEEIQSSLLNDTILLIVTTTTYEVTRRVSAGAYTSITSGTFPTALATDGTTYDVEINVVNDTMWITIGAYSYKTTSDYIKSDTEYRYIFWEHYYGSADTNNLLRVHGVWSSDIINSSNISLFISSAIVNGDTTHAPDGNSVFDALAGKASTTQKLDDFGAPDDNTDLNATTSAHGLVVKATAPAAGLRNVVGVDNAETAYTNKALFDATSPSTQAFSDTAVVGTAMTAARRDHKHAMPASPTIPVGGTPAITLGTANTAGSSPNFLRRDDTILAFDATAPSTQALGDTAVVGTATVAARRDHKHAMPAASIIPVKCTGTEITTGTNDTKFATPAALSSAGVAGITQVKGSIFSSLTDQYLPKYAVGEPYNNLANSPAYVNGSGHLALNAKNLVMSSGYGIDFAAHANAAGATGEVLSDYEHGTWTATIQFAGANVGQTYDNQTGYYVKIGLMCFFSVDISITNKGSSTGNVRINGLPFTVNGATYNYSSISISYNAYITYSGMLQGYTYRNTPYVELCQTTTGGTSSIITNANFATSAIIVVSGCYLTA